ncbi:hypothetical protein QR685DRAFT_569348 [Neurospora intermedia]|uniref:Uncharacterized protein n=1 Tax=Neurospora intermedia TaxID=5142 RepID=A0ABR3DKP9_NEUIN
MCSGGWGPCTNTIDQSEVVNTVTAAVGARSPLRPQSQAWKLSTQHVGQQMPSCVIARVIRSLVASRHQHDLHPKACTTANPLVLGSHDTPGSNT